MVPNLLLGDGGCCAAQYWFTHAGNVIALATMALARMGRAPQEQRLLARAAAGSLHAAFMPWQSSNLQSKFYTYKSGIRTDRFATRTNAQMRFAVARGINRRSARTTPA